MTQLMAFKENNFFFVASLIKYKVPSFSKWYTVISCFMHNVMYDAKVAKEEYKVASNEGS